MRYILIISINLVMLLATSCSVKTAEPAAPAASLTEDQSQPDTSGPPLTDRDLSMLVQDFTYSSEPPGDIGPLENCFGFPLELATDLRYIMHQEDADHCINYLNNLNNQDFRITYDEFFSLLDMTDDFTKSSFDRDDTEYICYRCDTDGDGIDELIAFEKDGRGTSSYIYMLIKGDGGYVYFSSNYIEDARLFLFFQYENAFYYAASCINRYTGTLSLQMFMLNRNIFKLSNIADSICYTRIFEISEPHLLYRNEIYPDIRPVNDYLEEAIYDIVYASRAKNTFCGDELYFQNDDKDLWNVDAQEPARDWLHMYIMDINNDGKNEIFTKSPPGYLQPYVHSIEWYDENFRQCPSPVEVWKDDNYILADMWFKNINGKIVTFTLYKEIQCEQRYLIDARIQENGESVILMDYMVALEPTDIEVTEFGTGTDVSNYRTLLYQAPDLNSAFPYNLPEMAEVLQLKVQKPSIHINNTFTDQPDSLEEIISGLLSDGAFDILDDKLGMGKYQINETDFYKKYGKYLRKDDNIPENGTQSVYQISLDNTDYFLLLQYSSIGKIGDLHIYRRSGNRLTYVDTNYPENLGCKVLEHSGKLYLVKRSYRRSGIPSYLENIFIQRLIPDGGQNHAIIEAVPESFKWQKIYDNHSVSKAAVSDYIEEIKTKLMDLPYLSDSETVYSGDENTAIDPDKLLRLKSITSPYDSFYKIDFNNDKTDEYISKEKSYNRIYTCIYQFTGKGIMMLEYDDTAGAAGNELVQLWFKEIDGKVFTFRLFYNENSYYILNVSLIEDTSITQVQTHIIVPEVNYIMISALTDED